MEKTCDELEGLAIKEFFENHSYVLFSYNEFTMFKCKEATFLETDTDLITKYREVCAKCLINNECI